MITDIISKVINLGFGALIVTKENVEELIDEMVKKGEIRKEEAKAQVNELLKKVSSSKQEIVSMIEKIVENVLHKLDIPTRNELQQMQKKLEEIIKRLESREDQT
ncbi:MAG: phasin family protein [Candidatus Brocadia sp.]|jgi:polyhydroxyalkanoate synthesis regulator phasin